MTDFQATILEQVATGTASEEFLEEARQAIRERCKEDLWFLCYHVLGYKDIDTELHHDMCDTWVRRQDKPFSLWLVPRGHLKTTIWTIGDSIREALKDPNCRQLIVNAKLENAKAILREIASHFESNDIMRWLFPEYCVDSSKIKKSRLKWTSTELNFPCRRVIRKEANIEIMAVEASLVSKHFDIMRFDDPVNDLNASTALQREKIFTWYRHSLQLRHSPKHSRVKIVGTIWHFDDMYRRLMKIERERRKYYKIRGRSEEPALYVYRREVYEGKKIIWPERFTWKMIEDLKRSLGTYLFSCHYMNNPVAPGDAYFKKQSIKEISSFRVPREVTTFAAVDLAMTDSRLSDYTAISVCSFDEYGNMYVRYVFREKIMPLDIVSMLAGIVKQFGVMRVAIEEVGFQKALLKYYQREARANNLYIPWFPLKRQSTTKFKRIIALQPLVESGQFHVIEDLSHKSDLIEEMITFDKGAHDDILDTLADCYAVSFTMASDEAEPDDRHTVKALVESYFGSLTDDEDYSPLSSIGNFEEIYG